MTSKITRDVLESHLNCPLKGYLKLRGERGAKCDYEVLLAELQSQARLAAHDKLSRYAPGNIVKNIELTKSALKLGPHFILDTILEADQISHSFDALKKVEGRSKVGEFHYVPVLIHDGRALGRAERLLLEVSGLYLSKVQGRVPTIGIVWTGKDCRAATIRLNSDQRAAERIHLEITEMSGRDSEPKLVLNDHCAICEFRDRCHSKAIQEDNISLLRGIGLKEIGGFARKGILTITQLAHTFRPRRKPKRAAQWSKKRYHSLQALALRDRRVYVFGTPTIPVAPVTIYFDIESTSRGAFVYLIGLIVVANGAETRHSFWADTKAQELSIFEEFLDLTAHFPDYVIFAYGSYEKAFLKRMSRCTKQKDQVDKVLARLCNTLSIIYSHIYFPTYSNGLKDTGAYLGCTWTEPNASGIQSMVWRMRWEANCEEKWKAQLLTYNLEDCVALQKVTRSVQLIVDAIQSGTASLAIGNESVHFSPVQEIDRLANQPKWGPVRFHHDDFEFINNCSYFDYQRKKVFVRTNRVLKKNHAKRLAAGNRYLRVTSRFTVIESTCPFCKSDEINSSASDKLLPFSKPRRKRAFDLSFTSVGIKRKVIEVSTSVHQCLRCERAFIPERYERLDKHFHGLKAWAMFQHIDHQVSLGKLQCLADEFFGIRLSRSEIHAFKAVTAWHYRSTYDSLLQKILAGNLMHADETEVKLKKSKGYVWVFTNLEEVVYMYRPNREADFLKVLLKDFRGVLLSDFYAAYDSFACPQQKCLIHLMRDMNQDLLNNPYDQELVAITSQFGAALRSIIATVDKHGLKQRYLERHNRDIVRLFQRIRDTTFRSAVAEALRERLLKYQTTLFTFIHHDGVPWNNNNAENAIKKFAYYREGTVGTMTEAGLNDYLVLLSICQSCRYKEVSFFKFLRSRDIDLDRFCEGRSAKKRAPAIEVYPHGFIVPHHKSREIARLKKLSQRISQSSKEESESESDATENHIAESAE